MLTCPLSKIHFQCRYKLSRRIASRLTFVCGVDRPLGCKGQSKGITVKGFSCCDEYVQKFRCRRDSPGVKGSEDWVYFAWFNKGQGNGSAQRSTEGERGQRTG